MTVQIKLHGGKDVRFKEIKETLVDQLGYEPSNSEVIGMLMADCGRGEKLSVPILSQ